MIYENKIVIESDERVYTISLDKIEIYEKETNKRIVIDTAKYLYRPNYEWQGESGYILVNEFLRLKIEALSESRWVYFYAKNENILTEAYNKLLLFDNIKKDRFIETLKKNLVSYDIDEIKTASMSLKSLFDINIINDIELYLPLKTLFFRDKESILRNIFIPLHPERGRVRKHVFEDYGIHDDNLERFQKLIIGLQYFMINMPRFLTRRYFDSKEVDKFFKSNKEIIQLFDNACNILENFKKIMQQRYNLSDSDSSDLSWLLFNNNLLKSYHKKWLEYCVCGDIGDRCLKDYIQDCYNNDMISLENKETVSTFIYYYCYRLNDPINLPDIKTVNEILSCIEEVSKDTSLKSMENLLFSSNSSSNKKLFTSIDDIDLMDGTEFEELIAKLFRKLGYDAEVTKASGDQGVDVIATKNGFKYGIQAKCYSGQVGNSAIQEVVAGKTYYSLNKAIVVTNNFFTKSAIKLAEANGVVLWDRNILKEKLMYLNQ